MVHDRSISWPRQTSLILRELGIQLHIHRLLDLPGTLSAHRRRDNSLYFAVQCFHLFLLGSKVFLILASIPFQLSHIRLRLQFLFTEQLHVSCPLSPQRLSLVPHHGQRIHLILKSGPGLLNLLTLPIHLRRQILQISGSPERLPQIFASENVHIPDLRIPVPVRALDQFPVIYRQRVESPLQPIHLLLFLADLSPQHRNLPVAVFDQRLPGLDFLSCQGQCRHGVLALHSIVFQLFINSSDLFFKT